MRSFLWQLTPLSNCWIQVASQLSAEDKEKVEKALHDSMDWLDHNQQVFVQGHYRGSSFAVRLAH